MTGEERTENPLEHRIRILESRSRKLFILSIAVLMLGVALMVQNFYAQQQLIPGDRKLRISDDREQARAVIHAEPENTALTFYDAMNEDRAMLGTSHSGSGLTLRDNQANQRIILRVNEEGPELLMMDEQRTVRFRVLVDETGGRITTYDESGVVDFDSFDGNRTEIAEIAPLHTPEDLESP